MNLWWIIVVLATLVIVPVQGRPKWVDGKLQEDKSEPRGPFWKSILGGVKKDLRKLFKKDKEKEEGEDSSDDAAAVKGSNSGIFGGAKKVFNKIMNKGNKEDKENKESDEEVSEVFTPPTSKPVDQEEIKRLTEAANQYLTKGDMNGVIDSFFAVLDLDPSRVDVHTVLGSILLQREELTLAQGFLYKAVMLSAWRYPPAVANLAEGLRQDSQIVLAKEVLQKGWETVEKKDDSGSLQYAMAAVSISEGDFKTAQDWFYQAAISKPTNADYWMQASTMMYPPEHRDFEIAEKVLLEGIGENPSEAKLVYQMGSVMHHTNRIEESIDYYEESLILDPEFHRVKSPLATAYHSIRKFDEAQAKYADAVQHEPENVILLANYALLLCTELGLLDDGMAIVRQAMVVDSNNEDVLRAESECSVGSIRTDL